jgi:ferredoxin
MQTARRVSQILFLLGFFGLFLLASYPLSVRMPVDAFLRMSPLNALAAGLAGRAWIRGGLWALAVAAATAVFGRAFCGWICPLGTCVDGADNAIKAKPRNHATGRWINRPWMKYFVLGAVLTAAAFSVQLAGFLDPISLLTRTATAVLYPLFVLALEAALGGLYALPFAESAAVAADRFLHDFLLPVTRSDFRGSVLIGALFAGLLLLAFAQRRYWCRNLCPLGALLAIFSVRRAWRRTVSDACNGCNKCVRTCRTGAIRPDFVTTAHAECIDCMDCQAVCPTNAVRFRFARPTSASGVDLSRRRLLGAGVTGAFTLGLVKTGFKHPVRAGDAVRPPGALAEPAFLDRCLRCGECVRVCSTSGQGLQFAGLETGWEGVGTPVLLPPKGYCEYNCNLCGRVCPTGAIADLPLEAKQVTKMGTAHFDKTHCIPWYYGENCMVCEEHCPIPEKAIKFREETVTTIDGRKAQVLLPYVVEDFCVGCGICAVRCPVEGRKGIYVTRAGEQRTPAREETR